VFRVFRGYAFSIFEAGGGLFHLRQKLGNIALRIIYQSDDIFEFPGKNK
jgi:hypothetical protein